MPERRNQEPGPRGRPRIGVAGGDPAQLQNSLEAVEAAGGAAVPLLPGAAGSSAPPPREPSQHGGCIKDARVQLR